MESMGFKVKRLDRIKLGPLTKRDIPRGQWRINHKRNRLS